MAVHKSRPKLFLNDAEQSHESLGDLFVLIVYPIFDLIDLVFQCLLK